MQYNGCLPNLIRQKVFCTGFRGRFSLRENQYLIGASSVTLCHLPPPGKAVQLGANIAFYFLCISLYTCFNYYTHILNL